MGFNEDGVGDQCQQRTGVRESEEAVRDGAALGAQKPDLQQRAGCAEEEKWQADGEGEGGEDGGDRVVGAVADLAGKMLCASNE